MFVAAFATSSRPLLPIPQVVGSQPLVAPCNAVAPNRYKIIQSLIVHSERRSCALRAEWWWNKWRKSLVQHILEWNKNVSESTPRAHAFHKAVSAAFGQNLAIRRHCRYSQD